MNELDQIRQRRLQQLNNYNNNNEESMIQKQIEQIETVVKQHMTRDAQTRYANIKTAHPEKATQTLIIMARALETRQITQITDELLKHFLGALDQNKKEIKIRRK